MKIKCLICGDIIESKSVHDLVTCKCESCYIDGWKLLYTYRMQRL